MSDRGKETDKESEGERASEREDGPTDGRKQARARTKIKSVRPNTNRDQNNTRPVRTNRQEAKPVPLEVEP